MRKMLLMLAIALVSCLWSIAQTRTITGRVVDENNNPVPGASVLIKGTTTGTSADNSGNFSISAKSGDVLVISSTNFGTQEYKVGSSNNISIKLSRQSALIDEVVVTALGIKRSERNLGYAVSTVTSENIVQKSEPDVLKSLQGKVPGVDIRTSQGTPGAATRIQLRGNNSFEMDLQPLIIVDGIPYSNDQVTTSNQTSGGTAYSTGLSNLDPNDIQDITVLKGASAAALYGSRAASGVLVITTKSGSGRARKGMEVTLKSSVAWEKIANLPEYQNEYGAGSYGNYSNANGSWGPAFKDLDSIPAWPDYLQAYPDLFSATGKTPYRAYPNNVKDLFKTGFVNENAILLNGGDEKSTVGLTASNLTHSGYVPNSSYKRYYLGLGAGTKLSFGLNVRGNFSYSRSTQKGGYFGENQVDGAASLFARTLFLARNWDLNLPATDPNGKPLTPNGGGQFDNPRWSAEHNVATTNEERFVAGLRLNYQINKLISLDYALGTNVAQLDRKEVTDIYSRAAEGLGRLIVDNYRKQEIESNIFATITPTLRNNDYSVKLMVGQSYNQRTTTRQAVTGKIFTVPNIYTLSNTTQQTFNIDRFTRRRLVGLFGDLTLGYKNFAYINFTGRNDWSSTLPQDSRSYFYYSIAGSFIFSDAFQIKSDIFDYGKIRASYAKVGTDTDPYNTQSVYSLTNAFLTQPTATVPLTIVDPNLQPEFTKEIELGTQLSFFKRKFEIDFTWYSRKSTNLLASIPTPSSSGHGFYFSNFGAVSNKGVEIGATVRPLQLKSFSWEITAAFTKNKNIVEELAEGVQRAQLRGVLESISPYLEPGMPYGYLRGTKVLRDEEGNLLINPATGGMIQSTEQGMIGDPNPDYKLGLGNTFKYKNFFLSALFDITKGGDIYSVTISSLLGRGVSADTRDRETSWVIPGVYGDPNTGKPILNGGKKIPNQTRITTNDLYFSPNPDNGATFAINTANEWNVYDATVYRLRELTIGYDFPKSMFKKLPFTAATITFTARNLWYLAPNVPKHTRFDPEVNSFGGSFTQGIELSAAPTTKRYGINLSVTF